MPRRRTPRPGSISGHWLAKRAGGLNWHVCWYNAAKHQTEHASLGTDDRAEAERMFAEYIARKVAPQQANPCDIGLAQAFLRYDERHGQNTVGAAQQRR